MDYLSLIQHAGHNLTVGLLGYQNHVPDSTVLVCRTCDDLVLHSEDLTE